MTLDFSALKKTSKKSLEQTKALVEKLNKKSPTSQNENVWKPQPNADGNGYAKIRFLPAPKGEDVPFVSVWDHGFQGPGGWYIENSLTTLGQEDPVSQMNSQLWNSGIEANKEIARKRKRRLSYWANIYIIDDKMNPDNNGKVMLFKFGTKIFEMIQEAMSPRFEDEEPFDPFNLWEGADFKLKIRQDGEYRSYDRSEFDDPAPLFDDDDKLAEIWEKQYSLQDIISPKNFKTYDELKARLDKVLGIASDANTNKVDAPEKKPEFNIQETEEKSIPEKSVDVPWDESDDDDDDEELASFAALLKK